MKTERATVERATILACVEGRYTIAAWGDVGIVHWICQADGAAMQQVKTQFEKLIAARPRAISFVHIVNEGAGLPDADARRTLSAMMSNLAEHTVCVAAVLRGAGFWASALQSLLTGMRLLAPPRAWSMRFAQRLSELSPWLAQSHKQRTNQDLSVGELEAVVEEVLALEIRGTQLAS